MINDLRSLDKAHPKEDIRKILIKSSHQYSQIVLTSKSSHLHNLINKIEINSIAIQLIITFHLISVDDEPFILSYLVLVLLC